MAEWSDTTRRGVASFPSQIPFDSFRFPVVTVTQRARLGSDSRRRDGEYQLSYADRRFKVSRLVGDETDDVESLGGELRGMLGIESKNKQF